MALSLCPDCRGKVSTVSEICVHCGYPLGKMKNSAPDIQPPPAQLESNLTILGANPIFPRLEFNPILSNNINTDIDNVDGKVMILVGDNGMQLFLNYQPFLAIHFSQITTAAVIERTTCISQKKSLFSRAIVGGVLLGGAGAVVAGMSGLGNKEILYNHILEITFYEPKDKKVKTINLILPQPKKGLRLIKIYQEYIEQKSRKVKQKLNQVEVKKKTRINEYNEFNESKIDNSKYVTYSIRGLFILLVIIILLLLTNS